jgi:hypothetical protein
MSLEERRQNTFFRCIRRRRRRRLFLLLRVVVVVVVVLPIIRSGSGSGRINVCNIELFVRKSRRRVDLSSRRRSVSSDGSGGAILLHF